ncbi:MAG TPA: flagellar hook-associated protein FlgK [Terriglobales bacterium]|nr:flagellar hook-associated protein FlgK [Terriglobales bacterium]
MSGLFGTLSIALSSLAVSQQQLETSSSNVANASTAGYSRETAVTEAGAPIRLGNLVLGTGVVLRKIESLRDPILEIQLNQATQQQSDLNAQLAQMQQLQTNFSSATSGIGADISNFFNMLQQLSPDPSNLALRQSVITAAANLARDFNSAASNLTTQQANLNLTVQQSVGEVNNLTTQLASVNKQIAVLENAHVDASTLIDQQTNIIRQLSSLIDLQVIQTEKGGIEVATAKGTALVSGDQSFALSTQTGQNGNTHVFAGTMDITSSISGGSLAGTLHTRDQEIPNFLSQLDQLAAGFSNAVNVASAQGFDLNGVQGTSMFSTPPVGVTGAAATMQAVMTDPSLIAASFDGTPGSNGNLADLLGVATQQVANGQTPIGAYSNLVFQVGSATSNTSADADAAGQILQQLQDQRNSVSGVSLDEEAANIIQYQTAYQAAARVVSTINSLLADTVNLGLGAAVQ